MATNSEGVEPAQITINNLSEQNENTTDPVAEVQGASVSYHSSGHPDQVQCTQGPTAYQQDQEYWQSRQKPVKEKNLKVYQIISVLAILAFFPIGIVAFYTAMKLKEDYYTGIEKGDLTQSIKRAALLDKLLILSFTMCVFTVILALALVGGLQGGSTHSNSVLLTGR